MTKKRTIKECLKIPLENIRVFEDSIVRQSLLKMSNKDKRKNVKELADSMKAVSLLQPIGVYFLAQDGEDKIYQLIYGYRRFLAAQFLNWKKILACVLN
jgi:ParB-like chromosome segregation protein Spo0J